MQALRNRELVSIRRTQLLSMFNMAIYSSGPVFVAIAAFSVHWLLGKQLTAAIAFPALSLMNLLRYPCCRARSALCARQLRRGERSR